MTTRLVTIREVVEMLEQCAPGYEWDESDHYYSVTWRGQTYTALPKGPHGSRGKRSMNAEIEGCLKKASPPT